MQRLLTAIAAFVLLSTSTFAGDYRDYGDPGRGDYNTRDYSGSFSEPRHPLTAEFADVLALCRTYVTIYELAALDDASRSAVDTLSKCRNLLAMNRVLSLDYSTPCDYIDPEGEPPAEAYSLFGWCGGNMDSTKNHRSAAQRTPGQQP